jgi:response regulator RpfG family c-di-GMP phosphodiesterase
MNEKILFVDDDPNLLSAMERNFRRRFSLDTATNGEAGLAKIAEQGPYAVVISDRQMPKMDGIQFLSAVRQNAADSVRIMLTGNVDLEQAVRTVNEGNIFRFLIKPCPVEVVTKALEDGLAQYRLIIAEKELLNNTLNGSIKLLTDILSLVDSKSYGRTEKVRALITELSGRMPLAGSWETHVAAMLSPIGYVTLPLDTLVKARSRQPLSKIEQQLVTAIPETTARLLSNIPRLEGVAKIARYQDKHFDGKGFPADEIKEEEIPAGARLLKILNDLLTLQAGGKPQAQALEEMSTREGHYDPQMLPLVRNILEANAEKPDMQTVSISVNDLTVGMVLNSDVLTNDGLLILSSGHYINQAVLEKIQNFNLISGIRQPIYVKTPHAS